jgi:hypothetical protein
MADLGLDDEQVAAMEASANAPRPFSEIVLSESESDGDYQDLSDDDEGLNGSEDESESEPEDATNAPRSFSEIVFSENESHDDYQDSTDDEETMESESESESELERDQDTVEVAEDSYNDEHHSEPEPTQQSSGDPDRTALFGPPFGQDRQSSVSDLGPGILDGSNDIVPQPALFLRDPRSTFPQDDGRILFGLGTEIFNGSNNIAPQAAPVLRDPSPIFPQDNRRSVTDIGLGVVVHDHGNHGNAALPPVILDSDSSNDELATRAAPLHYLENAPPLRVGDEIRSGAVGTSFTLSPPSLTTFISHHLVPLMPEHSHYPGAGTTCSICYEPFHSSHSPVQVVNVTGCSNHIFGYQCLRKTLSSGKKYSTRCPLCRTTWFQMRKHELRRVNREWSDVERAEDRALMHDRREAGGVKARFLGIPVVAGRLLGLAKRLADW